MDARWTHDGLTRTGARHSTNLRLPEEVGIFVEIPPVPIDGDNFRLRMKGSAIIEAEIADAA